MSKEDLIAAIRQAIVDGKADRTEKACVSAVEAGVDVGEILNEGMTKAMQIVGAKWEGKEYFLPDVLASAQAIKAGSAYLKPQDGNGAQDYVGTVVIGTVKGDVHNIGKNIVALFMEVAGFKVFNLGENVPAEEFVKTALEQNADVVGSSAFVTSVAGEMIGIEEGLKAAGVRDKVFTMIGGCVLDEEWAVKIGANAFGKDAMHAVKLAQEFMAKKKAQGL